MKKENQIEESSSNWMGLGKIGLLAFGGYLLWTNRFKIQRFLEAQGVSTPWMNGNVGEAIQSGASKVAGVVQNEVKSFTQPNAASNAVKDVNKAFHS